MFDKEAKGRLQNEPKAPKAKAKPTDTKAAAATQGGGNGNGPPSARD